CRSECFGMRWTCCSLFGWLVQKLEQRFLDYAGPGTQRGLISCLLVGVRDRRFGEVRVLYVREASRDRGLQPFDATDGGLQLVGHASRRCLELSQGFDAPFEAFQVG